MSKNNTAVRWFSLISYLDKESIDNILFEKADKIRAYAYILHDRDTKEDGTPKEPHYHILISTYNAYETKLVCKWFTGFYDSSGKEINTLCEKILDKEKAYLYLTHIEHPDKFQYSSEDIVSINSKIFLEENICEDNILNALQDMLDGLPLQDISKRYGRDFILHYGHIKMLFNDIQKQIGGKTL